MSLHLGAGSAVYANAFADPSSFGGSTSAMFRRARPARSIPNPCNLLWPSPERRSPDARAGRFALLGFAGNSAPDHIDHFHALEHWLGRIH